MGKGADSVSAEVLADILGVHERTIRDLATRGLVVKASRGAYAKRESIRAYCHHLREMAAARGHHAPGNSLTAERVREAKERADNLALRNGQIRRELVAAAEVAREWSEILRMLRSRMLALPGRVQQRLGNLTPHDVATLDREIRDALAEMGNEQPDAG